MKRSSDGTCTTTMNLKVFALNILYNAENNANENQANGSDMLHNCHLNVLVMAKIALSSTLLQAKY